MVLFGDSLPEVGLARNSDSTGLQGPYIVVGNLAGLLNYGGCCLVHSTHMEY